MFFLFFSTAVALNLGDGGWEGGNFAPQGTFVNVWTHFWLSQLGRACATVILWVEARDDGEYPTGQSSTKKHPSQNVLAPRLRNPGLQEGKS